MAQVVRASIKRNAQKVLSTKGKYSYNSPKGEGPHPIEGVTILPLLPNSVGVVLDKNKNKVREICYRAKQTHSHFHVSHNKAKNIFDLIHRDNMGTSQGVIF